MLEEVAAACSLPRHAACNKAKALFRYQHFQDFQITVRAMISSRLKPKTQPSNHNFKARSLPRLHRGGHENSAFIKAQRAHFPSLCTVISHARLRQPFPKLAARRFGAAVFLGFPNMAFHAFRLGFGAICRLRAGSHSLIDLFTSLTYA